jgi:hypothetical protein
MAVTSGLDATGRRVGVRMEGWVERRDLNGMRQPVPPKQAPWLRPRWVWPFLREPEFLWIGGIVEAARYFTAVDLNHWQRLHCRKSLARQSATRAVRKPSLDVT